jgi:hypothetical protein
MGILLGGVEINNRNRTGSPADSCLKRQSDHKFILTMRICFVNDINQAGIMLIVLDDTSDKKI